MSEELAPVEATYEEALKRSSGAFAAYCAAPTPRTAIRLGAALDELRETVSVLASPPRAGRPDTARPSRAPLSR